MQPKYTPEQVADIEAREKEALETLSRLQMNPSAVVHKVNLGNDTFADKVVPYLQDLKYANPTKAPETETATETEKSVEA